MFNKKIDEHIESKFSALTESLSYQIEALIECKSIIETLQYLIFLKHNLNKINKD